MNYEEKAFEIVKDSIKSAVFIDEKAKEFYSESVVNPAIVEEKLSFDLFDNFKKEGVSLAIHKFIKTDIENENIKRYLLKDRDLILLDWELDDISGEEFSLRFLSEIINSAHINFCCIYTRSPRFDSIYSQIETYFSGLNINDYKKIREEYGHVDDVDSLTKLYNFLYVRNSENIEDLNEELGIDLETHPLNKNNKYSEIQLLKQIYNAFQKRIEPLEREQNVNSINIESNSFIINDTIILILKKDAINDPKPSFLLKKIVGKVIENQNSFIQLLGLEMQTIFNSNESFIDDSILKSSTEAFFKHRNYLFANEKEDKTFSIIIKKLLIEHAMLKLRTAKLGLLDSDFLIEHSKLITGNPNNEELHNLNTFYNSVTVKSLNAVDIPNLNFGDIFKDEKSNYYLCITALCDCYIPKKIDYNFYFVQGVVFDNIDLALNLGDTAFISYLPNGKVVYWGNLDDPKVKRIKEPSLSNSDDDSRKLKNDIVTLKKTIENLKNNQDKLNSFLYKPFYIKPKVYNVENNKLVDNKIRIWDITNNTTKEGLDQNLNFFEVEYITTLRSDYTQRIANHAFGHPVRVGVDFIKN